MRIMINRSIFGVSGLLAQNLSDALCLLIFCFSFVVGIFVDVLVNAGGGTVGEEGLVIEVVVLIVSEAGLETCRLVEETLIEHGFTGTWLCLTQSNFLRDVSILVSLGLGLFEACSFHSVVSYDFSAALGSDLVSFSFRFFLLPLQVGALEAFWAWLVFVFCSFISFTAG